MRVLIDMLNLRYQTLHGRPLSEAARALSQLTYGKSTSYKLLHT